MASSSGPDFVIPGNCSHCSKIDVEKFRCPVFTGPGCSHYSNLPGLPVHLQVNRSPSQCCPGTHQPLCPAFPVRLNSFCSCPQCRQTQQDTINRRVPLAQHPQMFSCNSHWLNPVEIQNNGLGNSGFLPHVLPNPPCIPGHVGMATVDSMQVNSMSALSYHHHHHYHHYHYHHHSHSRNNLHPYAVPVFHPRLRRQPTIHRSSRHNTEEQLSHNLLSILTPTRVSWDVGLDTEQLENVVNFGEQLVDQKSRGLSKAVVENLPSYRITSKDKNHESRCVICLMDFEEKHQLRVLPCSHEYHSKCIDKWLKSNRTCPICRKEIKVS